MPYMNIINEVMLRRERETVYARVNRERVNAFPSAMMTFSLINKWIGGGIVSEGPF